MSTYPMIVIGPDLEGHTLQPFRAFCSNEPTTRLYTQYRIVARTIPHEPNTPKNTPVVKKVPSRVMSAATTSGMTEMARLVVDVINAYARV